MLPCQTPFACQSVCVCVCAATCVCGLHLNVHIHILAFTKRTSTQKNPINTSEWKQPVRCYDRGNEYVLPSLYVLSLCYRRLWTGNCNQKMLSWLCWRLCVCLCVGVCVVLWLSQLGHELFGRAAGTEAGFVRAFGTPRSLVHTIECGYTHTHTLHIHTRALNAERIRSRRDEVTDERDQPRQRK